MRLVFGPEIWKSQEQGGISRYFEELINSLLHDDTFPFTIEVWAYENSRNSSLNRVRNITKVTLPDFGSLASGDIYHATYYDQDSFNELKGYSGNLVVSVYDMVPEIHPKFRWKFWQDIKREYLKRANLLICISETTKRDLARFYPKLKDRSLVAYLGSSATTEKKRDLSFALPSSFFVYVGKRHDYKNFQVLLKALVNTEYAVLCIGGEEWSNEELNLIHKKNINNRVTRINLSDDDLWQVLQKSQGLVCTSRYEGFSLPVLEALTLGIPVICSDIDVHREIYQNLPLYFPSDNPQILRRQLEVATNGISQSNFLNKVDQSLLSRYTWENCRKNHVKYYLSLRQLENS